MQKQLRGRITEIWSDSGQFYIELMVGSDRHVFTSRVESVLSHLKRGDLVSLSVTHSREIAGAERLGGPAQGNWSPQSENHGPDSLRDSVRWRRSVGTPTRMSRLWQRQIALASIRDDLYGEGFLEAETPLLVKGTCPDTHIESIRTSDGRVPAEEGYLVTSTEYQIKRMIVGGFEKVFTLTRNFRANDRGRYHSSEFTMLEWARAYGTLEEIEEDAIRFIRKAFQKLYPKQNSLIYNGNEIDFIDSTWERLTVREAFRNYLGLEDVGDYSLEALCGACKKAGLELPSHFQQDKHLILSYLLDQVQSHLGKKVPTFLREWPAFMTSSALISSRDSYAAERSELYIGGIEIADGFPFLRNADLQRAFFERELERRRAEGKSTIVIDERYIEALAEGIPPGAGMALGVDRLVMVLTGATQLADVQAFSWDEL